MSEAKIAIAVAFVGEYVSQSMTLEFAKPSDEREAGREVAEVGAGGALDLVQCSEPHRVGSDVRRNHDEVELLRAGEYGLLRTLLREAPDGEMLARLEALEGDATPLGHAHAALAEAASAADPEALEAEFFELFIGVGQSELLPYASYYLTGFLNERPLAEVRHELAAIGLEAAANLREPEDHIAVLCEVMAVLAGGHVAVDASVERRFFERHLAPWAGQFFADLETAQSARFYRRVGTLGRLFMTIEGAAFQLAGGAVG